MPSGGRLPGRRLPTFWPPSARKRNHPRSPRKPDLFVTPHHGAAEPQNDRQHVLQIPRPEHARTHRAAAAVQGDFRPNPSDRSPDSRSVLPVTFLAAVPSADGRATETGMAFQGHGGRLVRLAPTLSEHPIGSRFGLSADIAVANSVRNP